MPEDCTKYNYDYLRISVTDRCNLNCVYCSPNERAKKLSHLDILRYEEMVRLVDIMTNLGVRKVRLTGGEPLIKRNLGFLVEELKGLKGIDEVSMTTNGILFSGNAEELKRASLDRVNISLDTLKPKRFYEMTGEDSLDSVWRSIMKAVELDLSPVKINVVLFEGVNNDEIFDFAELTKKYPLTVRFIEYMEMGCNKSGHKFVSNEIVLEKLSGRYELIKPLDELKGNGPSKYIGLEGAKGQIGFISSNTDCFCENCNRLRLSCDGKLYPCLFSSHYLNVRDLIRSKRNDAETMDEIAKLIQDKHNFTRKNCEEIKPQTANCKPQTKNCKNIDMSYIGG